MLRPVSESGVSIQFPKVKLEKDPGAAEATWMNGSFDPPLNLIYWGTGNLYPDYDGDIRKGRNLYSDSVLALKADSGKLVWSYQFTPHDFWDYDGV
jgi:alcohol dehydrogenase (cytochrome c)